MGETERQLTFREKLHRRFEELAGDEQPDWYRAWSALGPQASEVEQLPVFQAIRAAGVVPEAASFWLVARTVDEIACDELGAELGPIESQLEEVEQKFGMGEGGVWPQGTAPEDYDRLRQEYYQAWDELFTHKLEQYGEVEMARLFREDTDKFERRSREGARYFLGDDLDLDAEAWPYQLLGEVANAIEAENMMGPLGCRYGEEDGFWMIDIYPTPVELVGGAVDGEVVSPIFSLDVEALRAVFDQVDAFQWQPMVCSDDDGPRLVVEGVYQGREVLLQVLAYAPEGEEPGIKVDTCKRP